MDVEAFGTIGMIMGLLLGAIGGAISVWVYAPPVGGEWFFYIRVVAALIGAFVGANVGAIALAVVGGLLAIALD
jgi:hypothetical protein